MKNLPVKADENAIRAHFESKGHITDIRLVKKRNGESRRFAFVGFKTDDEALNAASYFNNSYMNSSRIEVAMADNGNYKDIEDRKQQLIEKRMKRRRDDDEKVESRTDSRESSKQDSKLQEFLSVMQPTKKVALWKNDNTDAQGVQTHAKKDDEDIVDLNELNNMDVDDEAEAEEPEEEEQKNEVEAETEEKWVPQIDEQDEEKEINLDAGGDDWLRQKQTLIRNNGEKIVVEPEQETVEPVEPKAQKQANRLFIRNLSYTVSRDDLESLFSKFGELKQLHIPLDKWTEKPTGIAFVEFEDEANALNAKQLDGTSFQGRLLHIMDADTQKSYVLDEFDLKQMPLKKQKAVKRRMQAAREQFSWNSLYMNPDTVIEAAAKKIGVSKSEFMDPTNANMAVQQALAESSMLESVQQYFKSKNIDLAKFKPRNNVGLSDSVILVKNLPHNVNAEEIQDMFAVYGEVVRTLMPPDGGIAVVQFKSEGAGRRAFQKLAFRRVGESIMYLQKAPKGVLDESNVEEDDSEEKKVVAKSASDVLMPASTAEPELDGVRTSVFIKNLNFQTQLSSLYKLFQPLAGFISAVIKTKPDPQNKDKQLSMGFGFAEFRSHSQAETAVNALQNHVLDGHSLQLKISNRGVEPSTVRATTTKIVIKNIPFETTKKDIVDLFGTFGKLRSVRVPRKFNRQTRGFAFAEFVTLAEAEHAMASLQGAHLLGRRLVMAFAEGDSENAEEEIEKMEQRVAKQVDAVQASSMRLNQQRGIDMDEEE